jgi:D-cysteine desulfhydrase
MTAPDQGARRAELLALLDGGPPRVGLLLGATPLHPAPRLSNRVGVEILFKRDDLTGLGFGGNKLRALDYLLADALRQGCDSVVTGAGPQSNWTMLTALASLRYGLEPFIMSYGDHRSATGNLLLQQRLGVRVQFTGLAEKTSVDDAIDSAADGLRAVGRRPYVIPRGGATPLGSLGYVRAAAEMSWQLEELGVRPVAVWLATGSCGTHAGLAAGAALLGDRHGVIGVTVSRPEGECVQRISSLVGQVAQLIGADPIGAPVTVRNGWIGPGYGLPSVAGEAATDLVATTEGIFLDPVFGAKAMAALTAECRAGSVTGPVVFLVTGGGPTLFARGGSAS